MQYMGEIFKLLRTSRHISLKEATGDEFSPSMLSRFENGESDITITKILVGLENIHTELDEYIYLTNGFKTTKYNSLKKEIWEAISKGNLNALNSLYSKEVKKYYQFGEKDFYLDALLIKSHMLFLDESIIMTREEETFLFNYLFSVEIWGNYELNIFSDISVLLPLELYMRYTREMLKRVDYLGDFKKNQNTVYSILLNGLFKSTQEKNLVAATYFDKMINKNFFEENDVYLRIVYRIANGQFLYCLGKTEQGKEQMDSAVEILRTLHCTESADYYTKNIEEWLKNFE